MATVPDKSGNSPIGLGVDPHIPTPAQETSDTIETKLDAMQAELVAQTDILTEIETNTTPA